MAAGIPARLTAREGRKFAFTVGTAFAVFAAIAWWRDHPTLRAVLAVLAVLFLVSGALVPSHLGPVQRGWMAMAHAISKVTTPIIMGLIYFVVLTPAGFLRRLFGGNPLESARTPQTVWARRDTPAGDLERQF